jgi:hypothetical protein
VKEYTGMLKVYTIHCPICGTIIAHLKDSTLEYEIIEDMDEIIEACNKYNTDRFPFAGLNGNFLNTGELYEYIMKNKRK